MGSGREIDMSLFRALVGVVIEAGKLPVDILVDVVTIGGAADDSGSHVLKRLEKIKDEAGKAEK